MKLVILFGPQAVGKMTVGQALEKITDLKLFHNHMTIELVSPFFDYGTNEGRRLVSLFRKEIFEAVSKSNLYGLVFTYVWAFDMREDWDYIDNLCRLFESRGAEVYFVELEAGFDTRLARNTTPNRLAHKPTKQEAGAEALFRNIEGRYRLNSLPGEIERENYIRIDNTDASPDEVARIIQERFAL